MGDGQNCRPKSPSCRSSFVRRFSFTSGCDVLAQLLCVLRRVSKYVSLLAVAAVLAVGGGALLRDLSSLLRRIVNRKNLLISRASMTDVGLV